MDAELTISACRHSAAKARKAALSARDPQLAQHFETLATQWDLIAKTAITLERSRAAKSLMPLYKLSHT